MKAPHEVWTRAERATPEFKAWDDARARCRNENHKKYRHYGGRGITMCDEWLSSYRSFLEHIGRKPSPSYVLDRINNDSGYRPLNVRWATPRESLLNRRRLNKAVWIDEAINMRKNGMAWEKIDAALGLYRDASRRACNRNAEIESRHA